MKPYLLRILSVLFITILPILAQSQKAWFELGGTNALGANGAIRATTTDEGGNIYAAGDFTNASGKYYVAKWDGTSWSELGGVNTLGANGPIYALATDGSGTLFAAGSFTNANGRCYVARWNGINWAELGGTNALAANATILALAGNGYGSAVAAGQFTNAGNKYYVAKWNTATWAELGGANALAANTSILALASDATGNVYAAGNFLNASGKHYVAKWNGTSWSELGGLNALSANLDIDALAADASGKVYAAGSFTNASGKYYVTQWDGTGWSELGNLNALAANAHIKTITLSTSGSLFVGGFFRNTSSRYYVAQYGYNCASIPTRLYVDAGKPAGNNGSSWANAYKYLGDALRAATACTGVQEIWVKQGTYYPIDGNAANRDSTFRIQRSGLKIYGGFTGNETAIGQRPANATSTLSGDLNKDDQPGFVNNTENSHNVVSMIPPPVNGSTYPQAKIDGSTVLDGFTISGGNANGSTRFGGGLTVTCSFAYQHLSPTISNCIFTGNYSDAGGAVCFATFSGSAGTTANAAFIKCQFIKNSAGSGGAVYYPTGDMGDETANFADCKFIQNQAAGSGGAIMFRSQSLNTVIGSSIRNCVFIGNTAAGAGGAINQLGTGYVTNTLFAENTAGTEGGAIENVTEETGTQTISNCSFYKNTAPLGPVYNGQAFPNYTAKFNNSILWYDAAHGTTQNIANAISSLYSYNSPGPVILTNCILQNKTGNAGVMGLSYNNVTDVDPQYVNTTVSPYDLHLVPGSPAINAGDNSLIPGGTSYDITGITNRILETTVDMGAYENRNCTAYSVLYVDSAATGTADGSSWANAIPSLADALTLANRCATISTIRVAKGTYLPSVPPGGTDRDAGFYISRPGISLFGGFPNGGGLTNPNPALYATILSGDIGVAGDSTDNSYRVIGIKGTAANPITTSNCEVFGFTITGGNANGNSSYDAYINQTCGGGIYLTAEGAGNVCSPAISTCIFINNHVYGYGGGIYCDAAGNGTSSPSVISCNFKQNHADTYGGAIYNNGYNGTSSPTISQCNFDGNTANTAGGAVFNSGYYATTAQPSQANPAITRCAFTSNSAGRGGAVYSGGLAGNANPVINNCVFAYNSATTDNGGAIYREANNLSTGSAQWDLNTFYANTALGNGGAIYNSAGNPEIKDNIFYANAAAVNADIDGGGSNSSFNSPGTTNPLFVNTGNLPGPDGLWRTADDGLALLSCSPAINTGQNISGITLDMAGQARTYNTTMDKGAYEWQGSTTHILAADGDAIIATLSGATPALVSGNCKDYCTITPSGAAPVSGVVSCKAWVDGSVKQSPAGDKYVQRHYDVEPASNAASATANLVLYYLNSEFQAYNAAVGAGQLQLPDATISLTANAGNVAVAQFHGTSATHLPGSSYSGAQVMLTPSLVAWNATAGRWEISISVAGFSGFFLKAGATPLPVTLLGFTGTKEEGYNQLHWTTANEVNASHFEIERSSDAITYEVLGKVMAMGNNVGAKYQFDDHSPLNGSNFYRLKMVDLNGTFTYSHTVRIDAANEAKTSFSLYPNPATNEVVVRTGGIQYPVSFEVYNMLGVLVQHQQINSNDASVSLTALPAGVYTVRLSSDGVLCQQRLVKE